MKRISLQEFQNLRLSRLISDRKLLIGFELALYTDRLMPFFFFPSNQESLAAFAFVIAKDLMITADHKPVRSSLKQIVNGRLFPSRSAPPNARESEQGP